MNEDNDELEEIETDDGEENTPPSGRGYPRSVGPRQVGPRQVGPRKPTSKSRLT
jgi:hypothetical protein